MMKNRTVLFAVLVALLQIGFLCWMVIGRAAVLRDGQEVVLKVEPVDPRDLLRGDYVRLGYEIGQIPFGLIENADAIEPKRREVEIYVRLARGADGLWHAARASLEHPAESAPGPDEVDIRGKVQFRPFADKSAMLRPSYGIERYYLPEGAGREIERDMRERPFYVKLAVGKDGTAQIKQFLDGEKLLFSEPLY